jgi:hypothetical protein
MKEVKQEAKHRRIKLLVLPTTQAIKTLKQMDDPWTALNLLVVGKVMFIQRRNQSS